MKRLSLLKTITNILLILSKVGLFFAVPFLLIVIFMPGRIPLKIARELFDQPADAIGVEDKLLLTTVIIGYVFYVYALHLFKRILFLFQKNQVFHDDVIKNLYQTGKAIIIGFLISEVPIYLYNMISESEISFEIVADNDWLFTLGLGLFFMVLSDVFGMAKNIKEENDLTV